MGETVPEDRPVAAPAEWPGAEVDLIPLGLLVPDAKNARTHTPEQVETLADLMLEYGFTNPILQDEGHHIIAGHGRVLGAMLNLARGHRRFEKVPVITARGWTEKQRRAYILADNQIALKAGWDMKLLGGELRALSDIGLDLGKIGFDSDALAGLRPLMGDAFVLPGMPGLPDGDKSPFVQLTFTLANSQHAVLVRAMAAALAAGPFDESVNKNRNGNALARIAEKYLDGKGT